MTSDSASAHEMLSFAQTRLRWSLDFFLDDLHAISEEDVVRSAGGKARTVCDFSYETILFIEDCEEQMRGGKPSDNQEERVDGWVIAPEEMRDKSRLIERFQRARQSILATFEQHPNPILALRVSLHTMYHDAQLNFLQTLRGDTSQHWKV